MEKLLNKILSPLSKMQVESWEVGDSNYGTKVVEAMKEIGVDITNNEATIPFPKMKKSEERVWEEYCPAREELKDITVPIPLKVVTLIKDHQKTFEKFEVWSESTDQVDPVLMGMKDDERYLMCRWGEALKPFEQIREQVKKTWIEKRKNKLQARLATVEEDADSHFDGDWVSSVF